MMQVSKKIPFEDPTVLNGVRALYVISNVLIAAIYGYVLLQVNKKKGTDLCNICIYIYLDGEEVAVR